MISTLLIEKTLKNTGYFRKLKPALMGKVVIDSRNAEPGDLFVAFRGENVDAHEFVPELLRRGVWCAGTENIKGENYIKIGDQINFLLRLAENMEISSSIKTFAITGSNGKTSTRELLSSLIKMNGYVVHSSEKNYNNCIGLPLSLLNRPLNCDMQVIEIGMNHKGEIEELVKIASPDYTVITNIGTAHIGNLGSEQAVAEAKLELFRYSGDASVVARMDDSYISRWVESEGGNRDVYPYEISFDKSVYPDFVQDFMYENYLTACACVRASGLKDTFSVEKVFSSAFIPELRGDVRVFGKREIHLDCYNANFDSMKRSINDFVRRYSGKNRKLYLVLGEMKELGKFSEKFHIELVKFVKKLNIVSGAFFIGNEFEKPKHLFPLNDALIFVREITDFVSKMPSEGVFLVKGSRGNRLENILNLIESREA